MAHETTVVQNGQTFRVKVFDHTMDEIDAAAEAVKNKNQPGGVPVLDEDGKLNPEQVPEGGGGADRTLSNLTNYQQALRNIGGRPRRNLLDNPRFKVDQRGQTSYVTSGATNIYCVDRWKISWATVTLDDTGLLLGVAQDNPSNTYIHFKQVLPGDKLALLEGKTTTLSILCNGELYVVTDITQNPATAYDIRNGYYFVFDQDDGVIRISRRPASYVEGGDNSLHIEAIKLEIGDTQTLAYQDENGVWQLFDDYDYTQDLLECKTYLKKVTIPAGTGVAYLRPTTAGRVALSVYTEIPLRGEGSIRPTVTSDKTLYVRLINNNRNVDTEVTTLNQTVSSENMINISLNLATGAVLNDVAMFYLSEVTNIFISVE